MALIKMGANTTLKDNKGNTPIDYIPENKVNDVYKNLEKTYKRYEGKAVGLRVLRAMVEIEENENFKDVLHNKEYNMKKYFESLENFAKNNYKDKTEEDMENILSIHIFNDKNKYVNKEREKFFLSKIKDNTCIVEGAQNFFKSKKLDFEGLTDKNKKWKCAEKDINKHYNEIVSDFNNSYKGTKVIRNYLLEENSTDFIKEKEEILKLLFLLTVSKDVELNSCLESDLKKIFLENPSQMNMIVDTKDDVIEFIWQNIDFDEHYMKTIWDNINFKTNYDVALKYMDLVDFNIKFYNKLEEKEEETLENIIDFINKHHFKQILLKLTNIIKKSKRNKIDDNVIDFLNDYREYLFLEQPLEVKDFIDNLVEKFDILEAIIGVENIELLRFMVENGRNINKYMVNGKLPLEYALENNSETMVDALIGLGANIGEKIEKSLKEKMPEIYKKSLKEKMPEIYEKSLKEKQSIALKLIEKGALDLTPSTMNSTVRYDRTFNTEYITQLMYHIAKDNKSIATRLINAPGIKLNVEDSEKITAYGYAKCKGYYELEKLMKEKEPSIKEDEKNIKNIMGLTSDRNASQWLCFGTNIAVSLLWPQYISIIAGLEKYAKLKKKKREKMVDEFLNGKKVEQEIKTPSERIKSALNLDNLIIRYM